jgi:hypothetical protein
MCVLKIIDCLYDYCLSQPISEEELNVLKDPMPHGEHLSEDEDKSH